MPEMRDRIHTGELYFADEGEILQEQIGYQDLLYDYNQTRPSEGEKRAALLRKMLAEVGENCFIEAPFYANWGGHHLHLGNGIYINYGLTCVDDTHIYIGDRTLLGPNCTLAAASHPIDPELRRMGYQYNAPVRIGQNCWLGAGVIVLPGVTVGDNAVIGAGSVVTRDLPSNVVAVGNPCRVLREVNERDREFYFRSRKIDWDQVERDRRK